MMNEQIIFFDGVCNLCNNSVNFVIDRDKEQIFRFAPLQSDFAKEKLTPLGADPEQLDSIILLKNGKVYQKSSAALQIARKLTGAWPALSVLMVLPKFLRDFFYDIIARNRYRWFGKQDQCRIPTPELRKLFLG